MKRENTTELKSESLFAKKFLFLTMMAALCFAQGKPATNHNHTADQKITLTGFVFLDKNDNAVRDEDEPGIPGVVVSDQVEVVATDRNGEYQIDSSGGLGIIFISIPNAYASRGFFWKHIEMRSDRFRADFALTQKKKSDGFSFIHASDPHLSKATLPRLNNLKAIIDSVQPAFVLMTGDLLDASSASEAEAKEYFKLYKTEIEKSPVPVWNVPGNHDFFGVEKQNSLVNSSHPLYGKKMYRHFMGPDYYSFNYGGVHFIGLNTVEYHDIRYFGNIDEIQLAWLKHDLSFVASGTPVVTFNHIPFYSAVQSILSYMDSKHSPTLIKIDGKSYFRHIVNNAGDVHETLKKHIFTLALSGHIHARESLSYELKGKRIRYNQSSAILGNISYGGMDMISGVILYRVKDGEIDDGEFLPLDETAKEKK